MAGPSMVAVIEIKFLPGCHNETVVKELCVVRATASETFGFMYPYKMADHGSSENGIHWAYGHIEYKELHSVVTEAVAGFAHLRLRCL